MASVLDWGNKNIKKILKTKFYFISLSGPAA